MTSYSIFSQQKRFGSLDGLRAISILAVIWHHTAPTWVHGALSHIGTQGGTLFFAISGFLITTLLLRERDRVGSIDLKAFYFRRTLRIFPLYYGVLLLYVAAVFLLERDSPAGQTFFNNLIYFSTFTSNIFVPLDGRVIFYFSWSLATEEQFYLIWPSVLLFAGTVRRAYIPLCIVLVACAIDELSGSKRLTAVSPAILMGALLALALHTQSSHQVLRRLLGHKWASVVLLVAAVSTLTVFSAPDFVAHFLLAALVGACVIREDHIMAKALRMKLAQYIGSISYGMYMLHMLCKKCRHQNSWRLWNLFWRDRGFFATLLLSVIFAGISLRYYESFFLGFSSAARN